MDQRDIEGPAPSTGIPPVVAARFLVQRVLGSGGMGTTLLARDRSLGREVVVKLIRPDLLHRPRLRQRFENEIKLLARVRHPNLVTFYDGAVEDDVPYCVMEYVVGRTLGEVLRSRGPMPSAEAVSMAGRLAGALEALHGAAVLHRDIKPSNVVIDDDGQPRLLDLGLAKDVGDSGVALTASGEVVGTMGFLPPEVVAGRGHDERCDVYQLGLLLYTMLTGDTPLLPPAVMLPGFDATAGFEAPTWKLGRTDDDLDRLVLDAVAWVPERRTATAAEFHRRCLSWHESTAPMDSGRPTKRRTVELRTGSPRWARSLTAVTAVAVLAALAFLARRDDGAVAVAPTKAPALATVAPSKGTLLVRIEPTDAFLTVDGRIVAGTAQRSIDVPPGRHRIVASLEGRSVAIEVTLGNGERLPVDIRVPPAVGAALSLLGDGSGVADEPFDRPAHLRQTEAVVAYVPASSVTGTSDWRLLERRRVQVDAAAAATETGLALAEGDAVVMGAAEGRWSIDGKRKLWTDRQGYVDDLPLHVLFGASRCDTTVPYGRLLGTLDGAVHFDCGGTDAVVLRQAGRLLLRCNDGDRYRSDNEGSLDVTILHYRRSTGTN